MLGVDLVAECKRRGWDTVGLDKNEVDLTVPTQVQRLKNREWGEFDWAFNCAAYTAVDLAETETALAQRLNAIVPGMLSSLFRDMKWRFVHISTDFVFDGGASRPYREDDPTNPQTAYGRSKLVGEKLILDANPEAVVCRTAWLYGPHGKSFPRSMATAWAAGNPLRVVADQTGSPTSTTDLAKTLCDLAALVPIGGIYHTAGPEEMTWHAFAVRAVEAYQLANGIARPVEIAAITTADWPTPAKRPAYSVLDSGKVAALGIPPMRPVDHSLADFFTTLGPL